MKYLILFLLIPILTLGLYADDETTTSTNTETPENYMDSPVSEATAAPEAVFGIEFHHDFRYVFRTDGDFGVNNFLENGSSSVGLVSVLDYLTGLGQHHHFGNGSRIKGDFINGRFNFDNTHHTELGYVDGNFQAFVSAISSFMGNFSAGSEVFSSVIAQGDSVFFDALGNEASNVDPSDIFDDANSGNASDAISVFAGRNTAAVPDPSQYNLGCHNSNNAADYTNNLHLATVTTPQGVFELNAFGVQTPIVLDMDGDKRLQASAGKWLPHSTIQKDERVAFDINGDGFAEIIEWVGPNDGLLVQYDGGEINGHHLFGDAGGYAHGFEKLSLLDKDNNGVLEGQELETLSVWQDANGNAKADEGEVVSVKELNITSIGVKHNLFTSSFTQNGKEKMLWDWHPAVHIAKKIK